MTEEQVKKQEAARIKTYEHLRDNPQRFSPELRDKLVESGFFGRGSKEEDKAKAIVGQYL